MKICVVQSWGFQSLDGSNLRVWFLVKELVARGHKVTVLNASEEDAEYSRKAFGCDAVAAGVRISRWDSSLKKLYTYSMFILRGRRAVKKIECDKVFGISFLNSMVAIAHPSARKCAMYVDLMSNYYRYESRGNPVGWFLFKLGEYLENITMGSSDSVITITEALKQLINKAHWDKTHIIPDGVDTEVFNPRAGGEGRRKELGLEGKKVLGYFGAVDPCDGVQYLAEAAPEVIKKYPDARFLVVGRGNYLEKVKEKLKADGTIDNFIFTGWVKNVEVPSYIKTADVCVVPNVNDKSIAPLVTYRVLEGMGMGSTLLVSDLPGIREVLDDTMAFFTVPSDTARFVADISRIFETPEAKRREMGVKCWEKVKSLDWRSIARMDSDVVERT